MATVFLDLAKYHAALDADLHFHNCLVKQFGKAAGDRRYDAKRVGWNEETKAAGRAYVALAGAYFNWPAPIIVKPAPAK